MLGRTDGISSDLGCGVWSFDSKVALFPPRADCPADLRID